MEIMDNVEEKDSEKSKHFACDNCGKIYKTAESVRRHKKRYCKNSDSITNISKTFQCCDCEKWYKTKDGLQRHKKNYCRKVKPGDLVLNVCDNCGKGFKTSGNYMKHAKQCNGKFSKSVKGKKQTFKCSECSKQFKTRSKLYIHRNSQHGGASQKESEFKMDNPPWLNEENEII